MRRFIKYIRRCYDDCDLLSVKKLTYFINLAIESSVHIFVYARPTKTPPNIRVLGNSSLTRKTITKKHVVDFFVCVF